ncbi:ATP-dependent helicase [Aeromicrobium sp. CF4.19]|uniref:ATP-dependent helicase n=1 Tax=Aeromicrobium sp. CF4.19 TaxID=3373082 RepID=UPI003EE43A96
MPVEYLLQRPGDGPVRPPVRLDPTQQQVIDHVATVGGPLQVLAGPGAGKTTTLVELVADRVHGGAVGTDEVLVLTFSRKAAQEVRSRIARRLDRTTATTPAMTFHSFCYALLRAEQPASEYAQPIRLLSAPEQDAVIAEVLAGTDPEQWPTALRPALRTRGLTTELQRLMGAARARGMDALDLEHLGDEHGRADWSAAGRFFDELTAVASFANTIDHTDLVFQAVRLLQDPDVRERWRRRLRLVVVDEYQDTDPLQVALLQALAGDGRDLVVVGDPYQSIYGFRGADVTGILRFRENFTWAGGRPETITLGRTNRYGPTIAAAVRSVVENRGALGAVDGSRFDALRRPESTVEDPGTVQVHTYASATAEAEHIALTLREAHLKAEVPLAWDRMAVLVRSGAQLGPLQRTLTAAGVPVEVAGDELPLVLEPAVRTLVGALHAAETLHRGEHLDPAVAAALLTGPLGGLDAGSLRRLGRVLRRAEADAEGRPRSSRLLVAEALADATFLDSLRAPGPTGDAVAAARDVARLLGRAAQQIDADASAEEVLWTLWDGTSWPRRLQAEAEGDGEGAGRADHDLDALCALFAEAARAEEREAHRTVAEVVRALESQQIPGDTLAQQGQSGAAVQLMTAHRSKGLEWDLVVVAGVQDDVWPDTRLRSTLLQADRLGVDGPLPPATARTSAAEERRLFYVACSRARRHLVVTAVQSGTDEGDQPSRFVTELHAHVSGAAPTTRSLPEVRHRPHRAMSLRSAVAELRRIGEGTEDPAVRRRAAEQLARLATHPAGRAAHPQHWWGLAAPTAAETPVRPADTPLRLSGSQVSTLMTCPLQWFLDHEARGGQGTSSAQGFGSIVHAIAADVVESGLEADPVALAAHLDEVWPELEYAPWVSGREKQAAVEAIGRFCRWHTENPREVVAAEHDFTVEVDVDGRTVQLSGSMDRVEVGVDGVHVVDLKTSKNPPGSKDIAVHPQLGVYQVAVDAGATADVAEGAPAAGAELVQLRAEAGSTGLPKVQPQDGPRPDEPFIALEQLRRSVHAIDAEEFVATASQSACGYCQFHRVCPAQDAGASVLVRQQERHGRAGG